MRLAYLDFRPRWPAHARNMTDGTIDAILAIIWFINHPWLEWEWISFSCCFWDVMQGGGQLVRGGLVNLAPVHEPPQHRCMLGSFKSRGKHLAGRRECNSKFDFCISLCHFSFQMFHGPGGCFCTIWKFGNFSQVGGLGVCGKVRGLHLPRCR